MRAASRHGTPSLTSLPEDDEVSCEVRPPRSPIRSLTTTTVKLEYTKERYVVRSEKGHKIIEFSLRTTYYKNLMR